MSGMEGIPIVHDREDVNFLGLRVLRGAWHLAVAIPWWAWLGLIGALVVAANLAHRT